MLDEIIAQKREEVKQRKKILPLAHLEKRIAQQKPPLDFTLALKGKPIRLIAGMHAEAAVNLVLAEG